MRCNVKIVKKYFGFLETQYGMKFCYQSFKKYGHFWGPSDCYSFYNNNGCFTIHILVQRGECGLFVASNFCNNQTELLERDVVQSDYLDKRKSFFRVSSWMKFFSNVIKKEILETGGFMGIKVIK